MFGGKRNKRREELAGLDEKIPEQSGRTARFGTSGATAKSVTTAPHPPLRKILYDKVLQRPCRKRGVIRIKRLRDGKYRAMEAGQDPIIKWFAGFCFARHSFSVGGGYIE